MRNAAFLLSIHVGQTIFNPRHDDEYGKFKVHFDLLMRNIIAWASPTDPRFAARLGKRIKKVIAPMLRQRQSDERAKAEERQFQGQPLISRLYFVTELFTKVVMRAGYLPLVVNNEINPMVGEPWVGRVPSRHTLDVGVISVRASFTRNDISWRVSNTLEMLRSRFASFDGDREGYNRRRWENQWHGHKVPKAAETKNVKKIFARLVLCSLEKIPRGRLASALPSYTAHQNGQMFMLYTELGIINYSRKLPLSVGVYIFDGIKSAADAVKKSQELKLAIKTSD